MSGPKLTTFGVSLVEIFRWKWKKFTFNLVCFDSDFEHFQVLIQI